MDHSVFLNTQSGAAVANDTMVHVGGEPYIYLSLESALAYRSGPQSQAFPWAASDQADVGSLRSLAPSALLTATTMADGYYTGKDMFEQLTHKRACINNPSW